MTIKIHEDSIKTDELMHQLTEKFNGKYTISKRNKKTIIVANGKIYGTLVFVRKNKLMVMANFSNLIAQFTFTILFILLGILIPLLFYFFVLHKKMKVIENDVATFITSTYNEKIINS